MSTFVSVGNATQPFTRLLDAVCAASSRLPQPVLVQHGAAAGFRCESCETVPFLDMEAYGRQMAQASLLILHAGAGSVIHAIRARKVPVVMPRRSGLGEHVDDHQLEFARELGRLGRIVVCEDAGHLDAAVAEALARQGASFGTAGAPALVDQVRALIRQHAAELETSGGNEGVK